MNANAHLRHAAVALVMGAVLSWIGFTDFGEVHRMFTFSDLRLVGVFAGTVALSAAVFWTTPGTRTTFQRPVRPGVVLGGVTFGVGWALTGACPSIALVQLGEGQWPALFTLAGIVVGTWGYGWLHPRLFRWDPGSCDS